MIYLLDDDIHIDNMNGNWQTCPLIREGAPRLLKL
jgi:hypothetical protein